MDLIMRKPCSHFHIHIYKISDRSSQSVSTFLQLNDWRWSLYIFDFFVCVCVSGKQRNAAYLMMSSTSALNVLFCRQVSLSNCQHSGHAQAWKESLSGPLPSPLSQFDMMNVQFPLSPHRHLITISINKVCPTSVSTLQTKKLTSLCNLTLQHTGNNAKSRVI